MIVKAPKGTKDVLPEISYRWQHIESEIRRVTKLYGFIEARTPVFEHTELFLRGVGNTTDIVQKEMYTFLDKGDRSITLKPEGTAGFVRMLIDSSLYANTQPTKLYYVNNPVFRYEKPQSGRLREHHQFGIELFGASQPSADAECIMLALDLLRSLGCTDLRVLLNSIGCSTCRPDYHHALREYFKSHLEVLCDTCQVRYDSNPLRILDCKTKSCIKLCASAPEMTAFLCDECRTHFEVLKTLLCSVNIPFSITPSLVRGLDYYTKTVFEIVSTQIGSQGTVCGGGRYDDLVEQLGGPSIPAVGFGMGMERLLMLLETKFPVDRPLLYELYIASHGERAEYAAFVLSFELRKLGLITESDHINRSLKAQFKYAGKLDIPYVLTLGEDELSLGTATIKRMSDGKLKEAKINSQAIFEAIRKGEGSWENN